ncbi:endo-1,4-beta-xylanase [Arcticibacter sp.]|uniref:endo-1,4-beta-xylanase n=1 Tax=Arcticibacter sp. TaxID=1872630 RepID=UPI003890E80E
MFKKLIELFKKLIGIKPPVSVPDPVIIPTDPPIVVLPVETEPEPPVIIPPMVEPEPIPEPVTPVVVPPVVVPEPIVTPPVEPTVETVGSGSGDLNLPNVSGKSIKVKPGTYNNINIGECTDSVIDATGVQMAKDGSVYFNKQATNTELYGIKWNGHYYRAIFIQAQMKKFYLHDLAFKDVNNYVISDEWGDVWDGTDKTAKTDWRFENMSFDNCGQGFSGNSLIDVEGNKITGMFKNFKMKGITVNNCQNMGSFVWMGACNGYDISDVTIDGVNMNFPDKNVPNGPHNGIFSITGNGKLHDVKCQNHQGNLIRGWNISFSKTPATTEIFNNKVFKSWKYGAFELQTPPHLLQFMERNKDKYTFANAKVYGNVAGKLNKSKDWEGQMLDLYTLGGGSLSYYDNIGFEMVASNPQYHPVTNMINNMSDAKVIEYNNKYYATQAESGIVIDDDDTEPPTPVKPEPVIEKPAAPEPVKTPVVVPLPVKESEPLPPAAKTLKDLPVTFGIAMKATRFDNKKYMQIITDNTKRISAENAFKSSRLCKMRGKIGEGAEALALLKYAKENGKLVHGQCIIWPKETIGYLAELEKNTKLTAKDWEGILKEFVQTWVKFFKGKMRSCDVVNEPFNESGDVDKKGSLRDCVWLRKLGPDYIKLAFKYAHEADSGMLLFLADYGHEFGGKKMDALKKYVAECIKAGVPIHGLSLQMHTRIGISRADRKKALTLAAATGLQVYISEFDMSVRSGLPDTFSLTPDLEEKQAKMTVEFIQDYLSVIPKKQQFGFTTWGVSDDDTNINADYKNADHDYPLFFDKNYKAKDVYHAILEAI